MPLENILLNLFMYYYKNIRYIVSKIYDRKYKIIKEEKNKIISQFLFVNRATVNI